MISGSLEIVRYLIENGTDKSKTCYIMERPAIYYASNGEYLEIFMFLLDHEADVGSSSTRSTSLLHESIEFSNTRAIHAVIEKGADLNARNEVGKR